MTWVLHETVRLSPRGVQALKRALQDHPHHSLQALFSGTTRMPAPRSITTRWS